MILLLIAVLSATTVTQGGSVNLTLYSDATVVLDECMYFEDTLSSQANLSAGSYKIYVTHNCSGSVTLTVRSGSGEEVHTLIVRESNAAEDVKKLDSEILKLKKELRSVREENARLRETVETLNSINIELYDRMREWRNKAEKFKEELEKVYSQAGNCSRLLEDAKREIERYTFRISELENQTTSLLNELENLRSDVEKFRSYTYVFQTLFIFVASLLIGSYFALLRR